jgi:hypothetical protein
MFTAKAPLAGDFRSGVGLDALLQLVNNVDRNGDGTNLGVPLSLSQKSAHAHESKGVDFRTCANEADRECRSDWK